MFGLFSHPVRRPRTVYPPRLRLETLEARANPAAPVLAYMNVHWSDANDVVVSGRVTDESPNTVILHVTGAYQDDFHVASDGTFLIALHTDSTAQLNVQAQDGEGLTSAVVTAANSTDVTVGDPGYNSGPVLKDVTVSLEGGIWHIRGRVDNTDAGAIVKIIDGTFPDRNGQTAPVEGDGSFDIGITLDPGSPGGSISIIAQDGPHQSDSYDAILD